ncbi:RHS repeat-associated core domain-containing protein|uniref:RHS repeat-associated core domain-containing protein n=1 Tax=Pseudomonas sp. SbOxS1 TaxID=2723884 RepID=UPI0015D3B8AA|nr:RHS repeat-associated core domain-containing protein [Pseudomonas sp. SbOxS1]NYU01710.1 RHS repeat-associated core domain-containing protein [Pseudomonas sp. SbOxS1]
MPSQNKEVLCTYHYDALDCLIGLNAPTQDTLQRFYCKSRLATEIQGLVRCSIVQQGDLLLAQQKRLGDTLVTALLATDQQRSVMHTVGGSSFPIAYLPYGHRRPESGLTSLLGFNGERSDAITGHYLLGNGYRAFNPVLMRFNSPDSLSPFGKGGLNSYAYCLGDPINMSDPTGNVPNPKLWFQWTSERVTSQAKHARETGALLFPGTDNALSYVSDDYLWVPPLEQISTASRPPADVKIFREIKNLQKQSYEKLPKRQRMSEHPSVERATKNFYDKRPVLSELYSLVANGSNNFSDFNKHIYKIESVHAELMDGFSRNMRTPFMFKVRAREVRGNYDFDSDSS